MNKNKLFALCVEEMLCAELKNVLISSLFHQLCCNGHFKVFVDEPRAWFVKHCSTTVNFFTDHSTQIDEQWPLEHSQDLPECHIVAVKRSCSHVLLTPFISLISSHNSF